jgi:catechol 2,3-dioxygenase-like lactoylglutathione lyase family enzyme
MSTMKPRVTSFAPQFLVDDLERSIAYYQKIGFTFGEPWEGFYAIGVLDGLELHLKKATKNDADRQHRRNNNHLDASAGVDGIEAFYEQCVANGLTIVKPITATEWGTKDFYVEDPDGYIIGFGGRPARRLTTGLHATAYPRFAAREHWRYAA